MNAGPAIRAASRRVFPALFAIALLFLLPGAAWNPAGFTVKSVPNVHLSDSSRYTSNPHAVLSPAAVAAIDREAAALERELGVETAVVAVKNVGRNEPRMFAADLFNEWKIGKKGEDNGLLILLITEPPERSVIFETGYGLEAALPDAVCYRLQQRHMVPLLKNNNYDAGMLGGIRAVREFLTAGGAAKRAGKGAGADAQVENGLRIGEFLAGIGLLLLFLVALYVLTQMGIVADRGVWRGGRSRGSSWGRDDDFWGGGGSGGSWGGGSWGGGGSGGGGSRSRF